MSMTLCTGPLPRIGSTRTLLSPSTRAMSEPKIEVAPPAGAVITVTVPAFMASRFGSFQVSFGWRALRNRMMQDAGTGREKA